MSQSFFNVVLNKDEKKTKNPDIDSSLPQTTTIDSSRFVNSVANSSSMGSLTNMPPSSSVDSSPTPGLLAHEPQPPTTSVTLPSLRPSQPWSQTMGLSQNITPEDFEAAKILACMKDEEEDRSLSKAETSTDTMNQQGNGGGEPAKRHTPPSVRRHIANIDRIIGGPPEDNCTPEVWDEYFNKFMAENYRQGTEGAGKWTQLAKGEQFIEKMRHQPFPQTYNSSEEDEFPKGALSAMPATQRGQTERSQATSKKDLRKDVQQIKPAGGNEQQVFKAEDEAAASLTALAQTQPATQSSTGSPQAQHEGKPKRRRTGPESLISSLGRNWEARVDEEGHRPARRARRN